MVSPLWTLCIFICVIIALIFCINTNPKLTIPCTKKRFTVTYIFPPIIGVILLLITLQLSPWETLKAGVVGDDKLQPYAILILIIGMSILCTNLDFTGALSYLAFQMVGKFVKTKFRLFTLMFVLSALFGAVSSSHSVVMTVTPLILYITSFAQISAVPYLFSGLYAANLSSLFFLIGNPTNLILASPYDVKFMEFMKFMLIPAIFSLSAGYFALLLKFHDDLGLTMQQVLRCENPQRDFDLITTDGYDSNPTESNQLEYASENPPNTPRDTEMTEHNQPQHNQQLCQIDDGNQEQSGSDGQTDQDNESDEQANSNHQKRQQGGQDQDASASQSTSQSKSTLSTLSPKDDRSSQLFRDPTTNNTSLISQDQSSAQLGMGEFTHLRHKNSTHNHSFQPTLAITSRSSSPQHDPTRLLLPDLDPSSELKDRLGAGLQTAIITIVLVAMAVSGFISDAIKLWHIALPGAFFSLLYCAVVYPCWPSTVHKKRKKKKLIAKQLEQAEKSVTAGTVDLHTDTVIVQTIVLDENQHDGPTGRQHNSYVNSNGIILAQPKTYDSPTPQEDQTTLYTAELVEQIENDDDTTVGDFAHRELCMYNILVQLPYDVVIFLIAMFILVQSLVKTGWVSDFAHFSIALCGGFRIAYEYYNTIYGRCLIIIIIFSLFMLILSNLLSAQPAAIFITRMMIEIDDILKKTQVDRDIFPEPVPGLNKTYETTMLYTVIAASNYAGLLTIIGSISGIIFAKVVNQKVDKNKLEYLTLLQKNPQKAAQLHFHDDTITYTRFATKGLFTLPLIIGCCAVGLMIISFF